MLTIRFFRTGKRNSPFFRLVVTDKKKAPRGGRTVEVLGFWNPLTKEKKINAERIKYWISVGAQPSDSVHNLLIKEKVIQGKKIAVDAKIKKTEEKAGQAQAAQGKAEAAKPEAKAAGEAAKK